MSSSTGWLVGRVRFPAALAEVTYSFAFSANGAGTASSYTTGPVTPPDDGEAYLAFVAESALGGVATPATLTGLGLTWTLLESFADGFDNLHRWSVYKGEGTPTSGAITATLAVPTSGQVFLLSFVAIDNVPQAAPYVDDARGARTSAATASTSIGGGFADPSHHGLAWAFTVETRSPGNVDFDAGYEVIAGTFVSQAGSGGTAYDASQVLGFGDAGDASVTFDPSSVGEGKWVWLFELDG